MGVVKGQVRFLENYVEAKDSLKENTSSLMGLEDNTYLKGEETFRPPFSNAIADQFSFCAAKHPFNKALREECQRTFYSTSAAQTDLERQRLENERLAIEAAKNQVSTEWSAGTILLVTIGSLAAITGMAIVIKKYAK